MSNNDGSFGTIIILLTVAASIGSGILAWNWVEPKSFMGGIGFILVWGILSYIAHLVVGGIIYLLFSNE